MSKRNNAMDFPTNRDRDAFGEVLKRSEISYAKGEFYRVEFIGEPVETDCKACQCGHANIRVVWYYGELSGFGSDDYCLSCFKGHTREWLADTLDELSSQYVDYRKEKRND